MRCWNFFKSRCKSWSVSFSEEELIQIFNYYSKGKKYLNYKDFVSLIFNNESLKDNSTKKEEKKEVVEKNHEQNEPKEDDKEKKEKENENEEIDHTDELILNLRKKLAKRGLLNLINIESRLRELDEDNTQELDIKLFSQLC